MRLVYSDEAVADLIRLRDFIAENDPNAAERTAADLMTRMNGLCAFPATGRSVAAAPEPDALRDFVFGRYVVRYAMHDTAMVILRIWHHREIREDRPDA